MMILMNVKMKKPRKRYSFEAIRKFRNHQLLSEIDGFNNLKQVTPE